MKCLLTCFAVLAGSAFAQIDSGGGMAVIGSAINHGSIGGSFNTASVDVGPLVLRLGLVPILYAATLNPDEDGDNLPDDWEKRYFGNIGADPAADDDRDGGSNMLEYLAGTDPTSSTSRFQPHGTFVAGFFMLPIETLPDRTYKVWISRGLDRWYLQSTITGDGTPKVFAFDETTMPPGPLHSATHPSAFFFRVEISRP